MQPLRQRSVGCQNLHTLVEFKRDSEYSFKSLAIHMVLYDFPYKFPPDCCYYTILYDFSYKFPSHRHHVHDSV